MNPQLTIRTAGRDFEGFLAVDSTYHHRSAGGVRIAGDLDLGEVMDLAREMSLKYALFRLPRGGAKAGIRMDPGLSSERRGAALEEFGRRLAPIIHGGVYYPGMDLNCGPDDLIRIYRGAGFTIAPPTDSSFYTALSTASALEATADALGLPAPRTLAVEGFGRVAHHLIRLLDPAAFRVVALATIEGGIRNPAGWDAPLLGAARERHGDALVANLAGEPIPRSEVLAANAQIYLPASRTRVVDPAAAERVRARAVVPIANAAYDEGGAERLFTRGILPLPGYLVNGGGVLGSTLHDRGASPEEIRDVFARRHRALVDEILRVSRRRGCSPLETARRLAEDELAVRERAAPPESSLKAALARRLERRTPRRVRGRRALNQVLAAFDALAGDLAALERA